MGSEKERFKVELSPGEFVSVKPVNIRRVLVSKPGTKRKASSSSSSSSSSKKKKKSGKIKEVLSPEEQMDRLLGVPKARKPPKRPKSPDMDPADIAAEAARAAAAAAAAKAIEPLKSGDPVEAHGLQ